MNLRTLRESSFHNLQMDERILFAEEGFEFCYGVGAGGELFLVLGKNRKGHLSFLKIF